MWDESSYKITDDVEGLLPRFVENDEEEVASVHVDGGGVISCLMTKI